MNSLLEVHVKLLGTKNEFVIINPAMKRTYKYKATDWRSEDKRSKMAKIEFPWTSLKRLVSNWISRKITASCIFSFVIRKSFPLVIMLCSEEEKKLRKNGKFFSQNQIQFIFHILHLPCIQVERWTYSVASYEHLSTSPKSSNIHNHVPNDQVY